MSNSGSGKARSLQLVTTWIGVTLIVISGLLFTRSQPREITVPICKSFLPYVRKSKQYPNPRFGINLHTKAHAKALGFPNGKRFHHTSWKDKNCPDSDTAFIIGTAASENNSCLRSWEVKGRFNHCSNQVSTRTGWVNKDRFCNWLKANPGKTIIVGNELSLEPPIGSGLTPKQYAKFYQAAWALVKQCDSTAEVAPYGPVGMKGASLLRQVWNEYRNLTGQPMPVDFYPVHQYAGNDFNLDTVTDSLVKWLNWLESNRGVRWTGPKDYRLTEYGLYSWMDDIRPEEAERFMIGFTEWLIVEGHKYGVTMWAWWADSECSLVNRRTGKPTALGKLYYELAVGSE